MHYNNDNGSIYHFAEFHELNPYEFDIIKRIVRCRKKGEFLSDIQKSIDTLNLYVKEQGHKFENEVELINKKPPR